jgi:hypothetical protein
MSILTTAKTTQACLKCNIYGWSGAGKTYAAAQIAIGLANLAQSKKPIAFFDSETGSDFWIDQIEQLTGTRPVVAKTRAFSDLLEGLEEAAGTCDIAIVDSATHFWRELIDAYKRSLIKKKRMSEDGRLAFQHWDYLKGEWRKFTDSFVNNRLHMIVCGRAGNEWDYFKDETGKMELRKTGTKMAAEKEFGFEPSLVLENERISKVELYEDATAKGFVYTITVLKDRWPDSSIVGQTLEFDPEKRNGDNPVFVALLPHISRLNLGGEQMGLDVSRTSEGMFPDGQGDYERKRKEKAIVLEAISEFIPYAISGKTAAETKRKKELLQNAFGTMSWKSVEERCVSELRAGFRSIVNDVNADREKEEMEPLDMPIEARGPEQKGEEADEPSAEYEQSTAV